MPAVKLPSTPKGWLAVLAASVVGFVAGTVALAWITKTVGR